MVCSELKDRGILGLEESLYKCFFMYLDIITKFGTRISFFKGKNS